MMRRYLEELSYALRPQELVPQERVPLELTPKSDTLPQTARVALLQTFQSTGPRDVRTASHATWHCALEGNGETNGETMSREGSVDTEVKEAVHLIEPGNLWVKTEALGGTVGTLCF